MPLISALSFPYSFLTQFGITPNLELRKYWRAQGSILDDPSQGRQIKRGYLSYAGGGPNTRDSQLFIAYQGEHRIKRHTMHVCLTRRYRACLVCKAET